MDSEVRDKLEIELERVQLFFCGKNMEEVDLVEMIGRY